MTRPFHIITNNPVDAHALLEESQRRDAEIAHYENLARHARRKVKVQRLVTALCIAAAVFAIVYIGGRELIGLVQ